MMSDWVALANGRGRHVTGATTDSDAQRSAAPGSLNQFLLGVEKRALRMAEIAVHDRDDALDIVQDAMFGLARKYADKPASEWAPLFFRILNSRIMDLHRRRTVRRRVFGWFGGSGASPADERDEDPVANAAGRRSVEPDRAVGLSATTDAMIAAVTALPLRQQQAFMLRAWGGLDVAATAHAMGCSVGCVKTHYSRAVHSLRASLEGHYCDD